MKINAKMRYGLRTMIELGLYSNESGLLQKEIAKRQDISEKYLDQIIASLKIAGLIKNVRGKKSGYILTRDAEQITAYDIIKAFESDLNILECLTDEELCGKQGQCAARNFWYSFNDCIDAFFKKYTLKQLVVEQENLLEDEQNRNMYYI